MQLNKMNFLMGFVMADSAKKHMAEKGIDVPNNFVANQALLSGMLPQPHTASFLLQNEVQKRDPVISPVAQREIQDAQTRIEQLEADNKHYIEENAGHVAEKSKLQQYINDFKKTTRGQLQQKVDDLDKENKLNLDKIAQLEEEVNNLQSQLNSLDTDREIFLRKVSDFKTFLAEIDVNDRTAVAKIIQEFNKTFPEPDAAAGKSVKTKEK